MSREMATFADEGPEALAVSRQRLVGDALAIASYAFPVGLVFGLAALQARYSLVDVVVNSVVALAGGAQFAAAGMVKDGASWLAIAGVTLLVNARHLLYSAATAPYTAVRSRRERVVMAHFLTDETFALSLAHFRRIRGFDARGYWIAAMAIFIPWTTGSAVGYVAGGAVDVNRLGLDVAFPAAMAGLSLGMVSGRRDVAAALGAVAMAVPLGLAAGASVGLVAGAVVGPLVGLAMPESGRGGEAHGAGGADTADDAGPAHERASEAGLP
jgi:4-azaleucine resistance transporter AzlC